jgi:hypothetical protein
MQLWLMWLWLSFDDDGLAAAVLAVSSLYFS